jgi:TRAP-type mannitol/chloroaromatic compound transport system permease large subunit
MVCGVLLLCFPVAVTLAGVSLSFAILGSLLERSRIAEQLLSLPAMLKAVHDPKLATGTICASVTLGQVIPPSIVLVLLGDILQEANTHAQLARGNFAPDPVAVVDLFAGAFSPGLLLVGLYVGWILFKGLVDPKSCPALVDETGRPNDMTRWFF